MAWICSEAIRFLSDLVSCEAQVLLFRVVLLGLLSRVTGWRDKSFSRFILCGVAEPPPSPDHEDEGHKRAYHDL